MEKWLYNLDCLRRDRFPPSMSIPGRSLNGLDTLADNRDAAFMDIFFSRSAGFSVSDTAED